MVEAFNLTVILSNHFAVIYHPPVFDNFNGMIFQT